MDPLPSDSAAAIEAQCRAQLAGNPDDLDWLGALGAALARQGKHPESAQAFARLTELDPGEPGWWMNLGSALRGEGRNDEALQSFARAASLGASGPDFQYNVALAHVARGDMQSARALLEDAVAAAPEDLEIRFRLAQVCLDRQDPDAAEDAIAPWQRLAQPGDPLLGEVGHLLAMLGDVAGAERALGLAGDPAGALVRLRWVQLLERTNRVAEARAILDGLLISGESAELGNELTYAHAQVAQREAKHGLACKLFRENLARGREPKDRHFDLYPLARSLDAMQRYEEAHEALVEAHASQLEYLTHTAPLATLRGAPVMRIAEHSCDAADVARWNHDGAPATADSPVFIVAFPRSGTTLLELALDAHPGLQSMDEQPYLQNALDDLRATGCSYPDGLAAMTAEQLAEVRARYWQRVARKLRLAPGQRLVDKNPLNLLRLPLIQRLFPNAHVLVAVRHPCDVILSNFQQHFRAPEFALLCRSLPSIAAGYRKAFEFWYQQQALLAPHSREVRYEQLVADFEPQVRDIVSFLGLPWDDAVAAPGKRATEKKFVSTPSYSQVVQPVTTKAVDRWHNYRGHFDEVLPIVAPLLARWSYAS
jgi:tetratricopeptide (TPR) repeat protein